jgi:hypothetical protein
MEKGGEEIKKLSIKIKYTKKDRSFDKGLAPLRSASENAMESTLNPYIGKESHQPM